MKKVLMLGMLLIGMVGMAQNNTVSMRKKDNMEKIDPEKRIDMRVKKMTESLNLTVAQQKQVRQLMEETQKAQTLKKEERKKIQEQRKSEMQIQRKSYDAKMNTILNAEQSAKWQQINSDRKDKIEAKSQKRKRGDNRREKSK